MPMKEISSDYYIARRDERIFNFYSFDQVNFVHFES